MKVKSESEVAQSCPTLSEPMDCSPPGSSVHGICQARVLEWGAIAFSDTLPRVKQIASGTLLYSTGGSAQCSREVRWVGGEKEVQEGGDICIHMADSH